RSGFTGGHATLAARTARLVPGSLPPISFASNRAPDPWETNARSRSASGRAAGPAGQDGLAGPDRRGPAAGRHAPLGPDLCFLGCSRERAAGGGGDRQAVRTS